jgi:hypothetical protein
MVFVIQILGEGFIVDLVQDYNGEISKSLRWYLNQDSLLAEYDVLLKGNYSPLSA